MKKKEKYNYAPYTIIYSILMLFHINNKETIFDEMSRCEGLQTV